MPREGTARPWPALPVSRADSWRISVIRVILLAVTACAVLGNKEFGNVVEWKWQSARDEAGTNVSLSDATLLEDKALSHLLGEDCDEDENVGSTPFTLSLMSTCTLLYLRWLYLVCLWICCLLAPIFAAQRLDARSIARSLASAIKGLASLTAAVFCIRQHWIMFSWFSVLLTPLSLLSAGFAYAWPHLPFPDGWQSDFLAFWQLIWSTSTAAATCVYTDSFNASWIIRGVLLLGCHFAASCISETDSTLFIHLSSLLAVAIIIFQTECIVAAGCLVRMLPTSIPRLVELACGWTFSSWENVGRVGYVGSVWFSLREQLGVQTPNEAHGGWRPVIGCVACAVGFAYSLFVVQWSLFSWWSILLGPMNLFIGIHVSLEVRHEPPEYCSYSWLLHAVTPALASKLAQLTVCYSWVGVLVFPACILMHYSSRENCQSYSRRCHVAITLMMFEPELILAAGRLGMQEPACDPIHTTIVSSWTVVAFVFTALSWLGLVDSPAATYTTHRDRFMDHFFPDPNRLPARCFKALLRGNIKTVETWLDTGGNIDAQWTKAAGGSGQTRGHTCYRLLHIAAGNGHEDIIAMLLERGATIDKFTALCGEVGYTALMMAAANDKAAAVRVLLRRGARHDLCGYGGENAMSLARKRDHKAVMRVLRNHVASLPNAARTARAATAAAAARETEAARAASAQQAAAARREAAEEELRRTLDSSSRLPSAEALDSLRAALSAYADLAGGSFVLRQVREARDRLEIEQHKLAEQAESQRLQRKRRVAAATRVAEEAEEARAKEEKEAAAAREAEEKAAAEREAAAKREAARREGVRRAKEQAAEVARVAAERRRVEEEARRERVARTQRRASEEREAATRRRAAEEEERVEQQRQQQWESEREAAAERLCEEYKERQAREREAQERAAREAHEREARELQELQELQAHEMQELERMLQQDTAGEVAGRGGGGGGGDS